MRLITGLAIFSLAAATQADRLIHIPLGKKVPRHVIRVEGDFDQNDFHAFHGYLDAGLTIDLDATIREDSVAGDPRRATFDFSYNYISPITDASPGISVGVQDAPNRTADGRRFYFASTFRVGLAGSADTFTPAEITLGGFAGRKSTAFVGAMLPLTPAFRLMAEHDGYRVNAGIELRPVSNISLKYLFIGSKPEIGVQVRSKF